MRFSTLATAAILSAVCFHPEVSRAGGAPGPPSRIRTRGGRRSEDEEVAVAQLPTPEAHGYADIETAAIAVLRQAATMSEGRVEYGGAIYHCGAGFFPTEPVTSRQERSIHLRLEMPKACSLAALYHVHPPLPGSVRFSEDDVLSAKSFEVPSYIGAMVDGTVRMFDPQTMRSEQYPGYLRPTAAGTLVAKLEEP